MTILSGRSVLSLDGVCDSSCVHMCVSVSVFMRSHLCVFMRWPVCVRVCVCVCVCVCFAFVLTGTRLGCLNLHILSQVWVHRGSDVICLPAVMLGGNQANAGDKAGAGQLWAGVRGLVPQCPHGRQDHQCGSVFRYKPIAHQMSHQASCKKSHLHANMAPLQ